ncbi:PGPGW domain-containing protein [Methylomarinum sp. Ch1-1]|uniref:PGPGW domain-containing protein n=1 Tax=Methylomarinum roseum TaxID=3067653 RepID=A0AAU7NSC5_9GAMM|nr:PGPGW domain-containing protein [Methylomarinum sp. Ch1-1]MDP4520106.1 PGPGW domain-containing protein [Methylomarinum sp. Ch1-1]
MSLVEFLDFLWENETVLWLLSAFSLISFLASIVLIPFLVIRIPVDYFVEEYCHLTPWACQHPVIRWIVLVVKNFLGVVFIIFGLALLLLPGQGLLTIFIGILCLNFPGKKRLERWLIQRSSVRLAVGWLRQRAGRQPLRFQNKRDGR